MAGKPDPGPDVESEIESEAMMDGSTFRLDGRLALITGSSAGIGLALARGLAQAGATVGLNGRNADKLAVVAKGRADEGLPVHARAFDVTRREHIDNAVASILPMHTRMDA